MSLENFTPMTASEPRPLRPHRLERVSLPRAGREMLGVKPGMAIRGTYHAHLVWMPVGEKVADHVAHADDDF